MEEVTEEVGEKVAEEKEEIGVEAEVPTEEVPEKERRYKIKQNPLGIVSAIIAFVSLALPWWTLTVNGDTISFYPWGVTGGWAAMGGLGYGLYIALILIIISGVTCLIGSVRVGKKGKRFLRDAGIGIILSIVIFAGSLQLWIAGTFINVKSLFYSGPFGGGYTASAYLSYGFWLALVAGILAFIASSRHPTAPSD